MSTFDVNYEKALAAVSAATSRRHVDRHVTEMSFDEARKKADSINAELDLASTALQRFPRSPIGLVSDEVRLSQEYRDAKNAYDQVFARLRKFNEVYTKRFSKELLAERDKRRAKRSKP